MSDLTLCASNDDETQLNPRVDARTVWLTQAEIAELFQTTKQNVSLHVKNILCDKELAEDAVVKESLTTAVDGKNYRTRLYNLDLSLATSYRVCSPRGGQFRHQASAYLKEYFVKGFMVDDERLEAPGNVSRERMEDIVSERYERFDQQRRLAEARQADADDLKALEQLEQDIKQKSGKPDERGTE